MLVTVENLNLTYDNKRIFNNAIFRIAQVISRKLVEDPDELQFRD